VALDTYAWNLSLQLQTRLCLPLLPPQALGPVSPLLHHLATTQPAATLLSVVVSLLTAYLAFFLMPLGDYVLGRDLRNPSAEEAVAVAQDRLYKSVLYAYCPLHIFVLCGLCHVLRCGAAGGSHTAEAEPQPLHVQVLGRCSCAVCFSCTM
jgi:hypothetical protein